MGGEHMPDDQTTAGWMLLPLVNVFLLVGPSALAEKQPVPSDFKIVAEYGAGYSVRASWKCTIAADGKIAQEIYDLEHTKKESRLTEADLGALLKKIQEADFFSLKKKYDVSVEDNPTLVLNIILNGKSHEVVVYAPDHQKKNKEVRRFLRLWSQILRKVPSPNAEHQLDP
jgi:hypothetical protein